MEHIHDILDVVVKGTDLRDDIAAALQFENCTAEVKLNLVLIQKITVAVFHEGDFDCFVLGGRFGQKIGLVIANFKHVIIRSAQPVGLAR